MGWLVYIRILALFCVMHCCGCIFVPMIESVKDVGLTRSHRMQLLSKDVKNFENARYWDNLSTALAFAEDSHREELKLQLKQESKGQKSVDSKISDVEFSSDAYEADVEVASRVYNTSTLLVEQVTEMQHWIFSVSGGWRLQRIEKVAPDNAVTLEPRISSIVG